MTTLKFIRFQNGVFFFFNLWKQGTFTKHFQASSSWHQLKCLVLIKWRTLFGGVHKLSLQDLAFFDHLPPSVYIFYGIKVYKNSIFLTTYPPPLVNVVCERPLSKMNMDFSTCPWLHSQFFRWRSYPAIWPARSDKSMYGWERHEVRW